LTAAVATTVVQAVRNEQGHRGQLLSPFFTTLFTSDRNETYTTVRATYSMDPRTPEELANIQPAADNGSFNRTLGMLFSSENFRDPVAIWNATGPLQSYFDARTLQIILPRGIKTGSYHLEFHTGCSFNSGTFDICELSMTCRPCSGEFGGSFVISPEFQIKNTSDRDQPTPPTPTPSVSPPVPVPTLSPNPPHLARLFQGPSFTGIAHDVSFAGALGECMGIQEIQMSSLRFFQQDSLTPVSDEQAANYAMVFYPEYGCFGDQMGTKVGNHAELCSGTNPICSVAKSVRILKANQ
jgi:hypothetical protein